MFSSNAYQQMKMQNQTAKIKPPPPEWQFEIDRPFMATN